MGFGPITTDSNGDVLDFTTVDTHVEAARTWINGGIVTADLDDSSIRREHVVRPKFWGAPNYGMIGRVQQRYGYVENRSTGASNDRADLARARDRDSIHPFKLVQPDTGYWVTRHGRTLYVPRTSHFEIVIQGFYSIWDPEGSHVTPTDAVSANAVVPGRLLIGICDRQSLSSGILLAQDSSHEVYPDYGREHFNCVTFTSLSAGDYDILLLFDRIDDPVSADPLQMDLRTINVTIDVSPIVTL